MSDLTLQQALDRDPGYRTTAENLMADRIEELETELKAQAFMSANRAPQPTDTHVETFMSVSMWAEFRP